MSVKGLNLGVFSFSGQLVLLVAASAATVVRAKGREERGEEREGFVTVDEVFRVSVSYPGKFNTVLYCEFNAEQVTPLIVTVVLTSAGDNLVCNLLVCRKDPVLPLSHCVVEVIILRSRVSCRGKWV